MKNLWIAVLTLASVTVASAQSNSVPPANVPLRTLVSPAINGQPLPPTYEVTLKWNERDTVVLSAPLKNTGDKVMKVLGVQATRGIFVGDFPNAILPDKEDALSFIYSAADNTDGDIDIIRVLTDQGIKELHLKVVRENAAELDLREVRWFVGDAPTTKTVRLTVLPNAAIPQKVRVTGGHNATLEKVSGTVWSINLTPASTAKSGQFAVFVDFDKPLPGRAAVILGVIQSKE